MHVDVFCMRVVFFDSIDVRMRVSVSLCHGGSNVRYYFSDL